MFKHLKTIGYDLLNLFLPATCTSCGNVLSPSNVIVCDTCYAGLNRITDEQIEVFVNRVKYREFDNIYIMFEFSKLFQELMHLFKYEGHQQIARGFARTISENLKRDYDIVSFVPLHKTKQRERGFNQSEVIASYYCKAANLPFNGKVLERSKYTKSQTKLDRQKRRENIHGAFTVGSDVTNKSILLIDDVITTGATLNECARILKEAKCKKVDIVAMATPVNILQSNLESSELDESILI